MSAKYIYHLFILVGFLFSIDNFISDGFQRSNINNVNFNQSSYSNVVLENEIEEENYLLGPGDKLHINIVTASQVINLNIPISPTGDILIPVIGNINLNNISLKDGINLITQRCNKK